MRVLPIDPSEITRPYDPAIRARLWNNAPRMSARQSVDAIVRAVEDARLAKAAADIDARRMERAATAKRLREKRKLDVIADRARKDKRNAQEKARKARKRAAKKVLLAAKHDAKHRALCDRIAPLLARQRALVEARVNTGRPLRLIADEVAAAYGLSRTELFSDRRFTDANRARQAAMWHMAWERPDQGYTRVAEACGRKDHNTAVYGSRAHADRHNLPWPEGRPPRRNGGEQPCAS